MEDGIVALKTDYGRTALMDALYEVGDMAEAEWGRKVIFVCSDGQDNASEHKLSKVLDLFKELPDIMVITLGTTAFDSAATCSKRKQRWSREKSCCNRLPTLRAAMPSCPGT